MNNDKSLHQSYFDPPACASDTDKTSTHSSKEGSSFLDSILNERIKLEYKNISRHYPVNQIDEIQSEKDFEIKKSLKSEKIVLSFSNYGEDSIVSKKRQLFKCCQCPKVFSNSSAIAKHKLTHSDERKYVCEVCNKAFKRQDHLNGHKHTHKTNKPHACHLCDRSYSDARSLRRHYENQHQNEFLRSKEQKVGRESGGSSVDDSGSTVDVFGFLDETRCIKCDVCSKAFKNQSALNGHMRLHGGYGPTKNSISGPGEKRSIPHLTAYSPEPSEVQSDSISHYSPGPSRLSSNVVDGLFLTSTSTNKVPPDIAQSLDQSAINSIVINHANTSNIDDLCMCLSPVLDISDLPPSCVPMQEAATSSSSSSSSSHNITTITNCDQYSSHNNNHNYSPVFSINHRSTINIPDASPLLPYQQIYTSVNDHKYHQYHWNEHPTSYNDEKNSLATKQWSYYNQPITSSHCVPPPLVPSSSSSNNFQDLIMNLESIDTGNGLDQEEEWSKYSNDGNDDTQNMATTDLSETDSIVKKDIIDSSTNYSCCADDNNTNSGLYLQSPISEMTMPVPMKKNKNRPAPIFIPPQTSAHMSRLRSPRVWNAMDGREVIIPPYTPPPMLSPQRKGSGLFNSVWHFNNRTSGNLSSSIYPWCTPLSSNAITAMSNNYGSDPVVSSSGLGSHQISTAVITFSPTKDKLNPKWLDHNNDSLTIAPRNGEPEHFIYQDECLECQPQSLEDIDGLPTSATPRINIGSQYQAQLPYYRYKGRCPENYNRDCEVLLWDPKQFKDTVENNSSLDLLMKIASSPAVKSCGLNMEYTFHLLCKFKGDLEKTLQALLEDSFVVYDYVYAETTNWTTDEINKFQDRLKTHDRDFMQVALDLQSCGMNKSVKACVEFYYVWKQMNNVKDIGRYRLKTSRKKMVSCDDNAATIGDNLLVSESGYNLRNKITNGNQKLNASYSSYDYKTSSDNSSREPSPSRGKSTKTISVSNGVRVKRPRSYHCSLCKRKFTKSNTLDNHLRTYHNSNLIRDTLTSR